QVRNHLLAKLVSGVHRELLVRKRRAEGRPEAEQRPGILMTECEDVWQRTRWQAAQPDHIDGRRVEARAGARDLVRSVDRSALAHEVLAPAHPPVRGGLVG